MMMCSTAMDLTNRMFILLQFSYVGLYKIGEIKAGETIYISAGKEMMREKVTL
jgi:hypothetical protein